MNTKKNYLVSGYVGIKSIFLSTAEKDCYHDWLMINVKKRNMNNDCGTFEIIVLAASKEEAYQIFLKKLPKYVAVNEDTCKIEEVK